MAIVQLEHAVRDYETWKAAFDRDPLDRARSGVRAYTVYRPVSDPTYIAVDLEFETRERAETFEAALQALWRSPQATAALSSAPMVRIVDIAESRTIGSV